MGNLPQILFGVLFFFITVPFIVLVVVIILKGKKQAWKGTIIDKLYNEKRDDNRLEKYFTVVVKLENGKEVKIAVDSGKYDTWEIGDNLEKKSGALWPEKI